jgi:hypothetical protein
MTVDSRPNRYATLACGGRGFPWEAIARLVGIFPVLGGKDLANSQGEPSS